jgi:DNA-binding LytR/AlgR family response regulator
MNALILDDEKSGLVVLKRLLEKSSHPFNAVYIAQTFNDAKTILLKKNVDVLFIDIKMPEGTGYDFLDQINYESYKIVVVTAHREPAVEAFEYGVTDYLLKPINKDRLETALDKIRDHKSQKEEVTSKISLREGDGFKVYDVEELEYIKADGPSSFLHFKRGIVRTSKKAIGHYQAILDPVQFFRIHHGYLVNLHCVKEYSLSDKKLILYSGEELPISVRKSSGFSKAIKNVAAK